MRVVFAHDGLVQQRVVIARTVAGRQPRRDAEAAQHQCLGRGELLAIARLDIEKEPIDRIASRGDAWQVQRVLIAPLQVTGECHDRVEFIACALGRFHCHLTRAWRQASWIKVGRVVLRRDTFELVAAQRVGRQIRQV